MTRLLALLLPLAGHAASHEPATVTDTCPAAIRCTIEGEIINRPSTTYLVLLKQSDFFYTARVIHIPVREN
ncbi:MAG: hypothetical protein LBF09_00205, partial [Odoribacteraceae bacterium]|nr:hypothetical protein [Odoribacteraceae bacterium]